jgi:hypothetical protein
MVIDVSVGNTLGTNQFFYIIHHQTNFSFAYAQPQGLFSSEFICNSQGFPGLNWKSQGSHVQNIVLKYAIVILNNDHVHDYPFSIAKLLFEL